YDVIHTHIYSAQLWTAFSSYFLPAKRYITTEHNTNNNRRGKSIFRYLDRWMYSRYDEIVSIGQATQKNLIDWLGIKKIENYRIITNAIKLEKFYSIKGIDKSFLNENFKVDDILISMVGRFSQQKDHNTLLEALSYLPPNIKLLLLGSGENKEAMKKCEELFLSDRVYFLGYCSNASEIVKSCKINILSSNWEGFGLAALESMAMGVPTIGSDVSGLKEVLENGGLIFKKGDAFQLSNLIKKLISNNSFYIEVSNRCILKSKEYSFEKMFNSYLEIYGVE
ncbi:MAG: glycosyltransferase, partial [Cetobacterium sp.]